ncbi:MAG: beta-N-acetylhexosaminidase [Elusimicrobia bacterium]|nr:beta-N-acetylhexosaminidase [Elusimicrobiota bacterium]
MSEPGFLFMFGIYGTKPNKETVSLFKETGASSVLLLGRNIETPSQTKALCSELVQRLGRPLLFAVDHEGGWVLRFKAGLTAFPGNAALGRAGDPRLAYRTGTVMAGELLAMGIQLNLAPVLDVLTKTYNPGIGIRSFGPDPKLVSRLGAAFITGMQKRGVSACAKHFPGKGAATVDAHVQLPTIRIKKPEFFREHLSPFAAAVKAGVHCVMTSHVRFPALDKKIATFSRPITRDILRGRLGFKGAIISDDLCMGAVTGSMPVQLAAVEAIQAGHDLLIIAHDKTAMAESAELLAGAVSDGLVERSEIAASAGRIARLLELRRPRAGKPEPRQGTRIADRVAVKSVELVQQGVLRLPLPPDLILFPDFEQVKARFTFEGGPRGPEKWLKGRCGARLLRAPVESGGVGRLAPAVDGAGRIFFFCFEAMRFPGQKAVLEMLKRRAAARTAVCLIRSSWDRELLDRRMTAIDARGYRLCQLGAALDKMLL